MHFNPVAFAILFKIHSAYCALGSEERLKTLNEITQKPIILQLQYTVG